MIINNRIRLPDLWFISVVLSWGTGIAQGADGQGQTLQSHQSIRDAARAYSIERAKGRYKQVVAEPGMLDSRLRFARCGQPLTAFASPGGKLSGRTTVGVRCDGPKPWSLYVPVQVSIPGRVAVTVRDLPRGHTIAGSDVRLMDTDLSNLHRGYFTDLSEVIGKTVRRTVRREKILSPGYVKSPEAIKRGASVIILASSGGIIVRMKGEALENGGIGDRINVRNTSSQRELEARVVSAGTVRVDM